MGSLGGDSFCTTPRSLCSAPPRQFCMRNQGAGRAAVAAAAVAQHPQQMPIISGSSHGCDGRGRGGSSNSNGRSVGAAGPSSLTRKP
eukprot:40645-Chlamydomonas_euryale.AAC.6